MKMMMSHSVSLELREGGSPVARDALHGLDEVGVDGLAGGLFRLGLSKKNHPITSDAWYDK
jgi:hypothetical protein